MKRPVKQWGSISDEEGVLCIVKPLIAKLLAGILVKSGNLLIFFFMMALKTAKHAGNNR